MGHTGLIECAIFCPILQGSNANQTHAMKTEALPTKLAKEPMIDATCEVRFSSGVPASAVVPGLLFTKLGNVSNIEPLPASQLPAQIRNSDPQFEFAALSRLNWDRYWIMVGDKSVAIGCKMPYPGWAAFREAILQVVSQLAELPFITAIERHSLKYIDIFDTGGDHALALRKFDLDLRLGKQQIKTEHTVLRVEMTRPPFLHVVQIITAAHVQQDSLVQRSGAVLDVDTVRAERRTDLPSFYSELPSLLDDIHSANKQVFFECLSVEGLESLEPQYE